MSQCGSAVPEHRLVLAVAVQVTGAIVGDTPPSAWLLGEPKYSDDDRPALAVTAPLGWA